MCPEARCSCCCRSLPGAAPSAKRPPPPATLLCPSSTQRRRPRRPRGAGRFQSLARGEAASRRNAEARARGKRPQQRVQTPSIKKQEAAQIGSAFAFKTIAMLPGNKPRAEADGRTNPTLPGQPGFTGRSAQQAPPAAPRRPAAPRPPLASPEHEPTESRGPFHQQSAPRHLPCASRRPAPSACQPLPTAQETPADTPGKRQFSILAGLHPEPSQPHTGLNTPLASLPSRGYLPAASCYSTDSCF